MEERERVRRSVDRWGLRVLCCNCGDEERHKPATGRLRDQRSVCCGAPMMLRAWVYKRVDGRLVNAVKARAKIQAARDQLRLFS